MCSGIFLATTICSSPLPDGREAATVAPGSPGGSGCVFRMLSRLTTSMPRSRASTVPCGASSVSASAAAMNAGTGFTTSLLSYDSLSRSASLPRRRGGPRELVEQRFPRRDFPRRLEQLAAPRDGPTQSPEKARLGLDAVKQAGERRRVADREIAWIVPAEQPDRAVDARGEYRHACGHSLGNDVG